VWIKLIAVVVIATAAIADWSRPPTRQVSVAVYEKAVIGSYRHFVRPLTHRYFHCRFEPTCSHYSEEAVRVHGFPKGVCLSAWRMMRCMPWVAAGTHDPVDQIPRPK
jgi:putative membrane protein insertion efficiency factor